MILKCFNRRKTLISLPLSLAHETHASCTHIATKCTKHTHTAQWTQTHPETEFRQLKVYKTYVCVHTHTHAHTHTTQCTQTHPEIVLWHRCDNVKMKLLFLGLAILESCCGGQHHSVHQLDGDINQTKYSSHVDVNTRLQHQSKQDKMGKHVTKIPFRS